MVSVMLYPCILCVALLMDLFVLCVACLTVLVNCLVKQFAICLGVVVILLLNVVGSVYGLGVVVVSAGHVCGTWGSGIVYSAAGVLWMSVVCGMRGVGRVWNAKRRGTHTNIPLMDGPTLNKEVVQCFISYEPVVLMSYSEEFQRFPSTRGSTISNS